MIFSICFPGDRGVKLLSLTQLDLMHKNAPNLRLLKYTSRADFFLFFLTHLQEFFEKRGRELMVLDPLYDTDAGKSEVTTIGVDSEDFGQVFFLVDEHNYEVTLFFYSEKFSHKFFLMENERIEEITIKTYYFWLNALFAFHSSYLENTFEKEH